MSETLIRPSLPTDVAAITEIYAWNVLHGTGTFETEPPDATEMERRRDEVLGRGLPWLVIEVDGHDGRGPQVVGYAYANLFRLRPAWRFSLEDSIYLGPQAHRRGLGRLLLAEQIGRAHV